MKHFPAKNLCLLLLASMIWGTGFVAQAVGMDHLGPFAFNAIRGRRGAHPRPSVFRPLQKRGAESGRAGQPQDAAHRRPVLRPGPGGGLLFTAGGDAVHHRGQGGLHHRHVHRHRPHSGPVFPQKSGREALDQRGRCHVRPVSAVYERLPPAPEGRPACAPRAAPWP